MTPNIHLNNSANIATDQKARSTSSQSSGAEPGKAGAFSQILDKAQQQSPRKQGANDGFDATIVSNTANEPEKLPAWLMSRAASAGNDEKQPAGAEPKVADDKTANDGKSAQNGLMMALQAVGAGKAAPPVQGAAATTTGDAKVPALQRIAIDLSDLPTQPEGENSAPGKAVGQVDTSSEQDGPRIFPAQPAIASADATLVKSGLAKADTLLDAPLDGVKAISSPKLDEEPPRPLPLGSHATAERVSVVSVQSVPTPVPHQIGQTALNLVGSIAGNSNWQAMLPTAGTSAFSAPSHLAPAHMLKIELHPAELGMVQVGLRLTGGQLSIEITPQTHEAWRHLTSDTEAIARSMRDLGFDVGKVTLLQPAIAAAAPARPDGGGNLAGAGRDQSSQQQGQAGSGGSNDQQSGPNHRQEQGQNRRAWVAERRPAGRGLFI